MAEAFTDPTMLRLRDLALAYPETSEVGSCVNQAYRARKKNFVFLGEKPDECRIMLKLDASREEAAESAGADERLRVADSGWVTMLFPPGDPPPVDLGRWIDESFRLLAPKTLIKLHDN